MPLELGSGSDQSIVDQRLSGVQRDSGSMQTRTGSMLKVFRILLRNQEFPDLRGANSHLWGRTIRLQPKA